MVMGDLEQRGDLVRGVELWRTEFLGWGVTHRFLTDTWCVPRRYVVIDEGRILATGETHGPYLVPGEIYRLIVRENVETDWIPSDPHEGAPGS